MQPEGTLILNPIEREHGPGDLLKGYLLGRLLGRGAHGAVYEATGPANAGPFAIKIISTQGHPPSFVERILRECSISTRLRHPDIIAVHEAGSIGSSLYIVMDVASGKACDRINDGRLGWELAARIAQRVALALDYVYSQHQVIHRDIKPGNIVVDIIGGELKTVKVVDFGLSRTVDESGDDLTMTGMILGTPYYMSPEQARGDRDLTFATDLYALGATLFHLIAGRPPFPKGSPVEILMQHCSHAPPGLAEVQPHCPPAVAAVVAKALAKDPAARHASYRAFAEALERAIEEGPSPFDVRPTVTPSGMVIPTTARQAAPGTKPTSSTWRRPLTPAIPEPEEAPDPAAGSGSSALQDLQRNRVRNITSSYRLRAHIAKPKPPPLPVGGEAQLVTALRDPTAPPPEAKPSTESLRPSQRQLPTAPVVPAEAAAPMAVPTPATEPKNDPPPVLVPAAPPEPVYTLKPGTMIDHLHEVVRPLGVGAMGEVYIVRDVFVKRDLAFKILLPEVMGKSGAVRRFQAETSALATVAHRAFPFLAGKGRYEERDYLMMELISGVDLKAWMTERGGRMTEQEALWTILQLAQAMNRAYTSCGMVHRDIKPANLMFENGEEYMRLKIVDFGISTYIDYGDYDDYSDRKYEYIDDGSEGKAIGTPAYMSPEQCLGEPPSPLMDIYSIGCTFYHLITGRTPYAGRTAAAMMMKHLHEAPPVFEPALGISQASELILKRTLAKKPKDRYKSYVQLIDAVKTAYKALSAKLSRQPAPIYDGR